MYRLSKVQPTLLTWAIISLSLLPLTAKAADPWSFMVISDTQGLSHAEPFNDTILGELTAEAISQGVDLVLVSGDLVSGKNGSQADLQTELTAWRTKMQPVYNAGIDVYAVRGNHDSATPGAATLTAWNNVFSGGYAMPTNGPTGEVGVTYSFTHENAFFVGLDQYVDPHRVNQAWLNSQLAADNSPHVFTFGHASAFSASGLGPYLDTYPADRNAFWESIEADPGARTYFCGHNHLYLRARTDDGDGPENDVWQVIAGIGGGSDVVAHTTDGTFPGDNGSWTVTKEGNYSEGYGYVLVEVDGLDVTATSMIRGGLAGTAGTDYDAVASDTILDVDTAGWNSLDVTQVLKDWLDSPSSNNGLVVLSAGEGNTRTAHSQETDITHTPMLTVELSSSTLDIDATADTFLYEPSPDDNFDTKSDDYALQVKNLGEGDDRKTLLQFDDLSALAGLTSSDIISADLEMWIHDFNFANNGGLAVHKILSAGAYDSSTVTWNNWGSGAVYSADDSWSYTAVPEPATLAILMLTTLGLLMRRGRH